MSNSREKPQPERNEYGRKIITSSYIKKLCEHQGLYETPSFNRHLYLHFSGFTEISGLDDYKNLQALFLENNLIEKIENLSHLKSLRCLYLQNNSITRIENLDELTELKTLNLSHNKIEKIENLKNLVNLNDLDLSHNKISSTENIKGLAEVPSVVSLDLSYNTINDVEHIFSTLTQMNNLGCLYLKNNGCIRQISNYRKMLVAKIPSLKHLDEKTVYEVERLGSEAWFLHGKDAEMQVRKKYYDQKDQENHNSFREYGNLVAEGLQRRAELLRKLESERDIEKAGLEELKAELESTKPEGYELVLREIELKTQELNEPIDMDMLKISGLKDGKCSYKSGELDKYGNWITEAVKIEKAEEFPIEETVVLSSIAELSIKDLEDKLIEHYFNFESV